MQRKKIKNKFFFLIENLTLYIKRKEVFKSMLIALYLRVFERPKEIKLIVVKLSLDST